MARFIQFGLHLAGSKTSLDLGLLLLFILSEHEILQCVILIDVYYACVAEYAYTLKVDEKSDVYSFGVVLLELLTGRRPVGEFGEGVDIVQWSKKATNCRKEDVTSIVDPRLAISVPKDEAMHLFFIATLCIQEHSVERPTMREVVQMLSEFPRHSPDYFQSSSSLATSQQPKNTEKDTKCAKFKQDILV